MTILQEIGNNTWDATFTSATQLAAMQNLEAGNILLMPRLEFDLLPHEKTFLAPRFAHPKAKNISFDARRDKLRCGACSVAEQEQIKSLLQRFATQAAQLVRGLFSPYAPLLETGRASLRVVEIAGRSSSYRKDDTRLHVDAFPATPNQGRRILRVFTNINPAGVPRIWRVGEPFENVAQRFLPVIPKQWRGQSTLLKALRLTKSFRTQYDHIMLQIHDRMKADMEYQVKVPQKTIPFEARTTWIVQTDHVSHAAMSGQHLLEQTFYLPIAAMLTPTVSPLRTLERLTSRKLI